MHICISCRSSSVTRARALAALRAASDTVTAMPLAVSFLHKPAMFIDDRSVRFLLSTALPSSLVALEGVAIRHEVRSACWHHIMKLQLVGSSSTSVLDEICVITLRPNPVLTVVTKFTNQIS